MNRENSPIEEWGKATPRVFLYPLGLWILGGVFACLISPDSVAWVVWIGAYATFIHLISWLILGLPVYLILWKPFPTLWTWGVGIPVGLGLGFVAMYLVLNVFFAGLSGPLELALYAGGVLYGLISAVAAINGRRKNRK